MRKFISLAWTAAFILALRRMFITLIWEQGSYSGPSARLVVLEARRLNRLSPGTVSRVLLHTVQPNRRTLQCSLTHTQVLCFVTAHWGCVNMTRFMRYGRRKRRRRETRRRRRRRRQSFLKAECFADISFIQFLTAQDNFMQHINIY